MLSLQLHSLQKMNATLALNLVLIFIHVPMEVKFWQYRSGHSVGRISKYYRANSPNLLKGFTIVQGGTHYILELISLTE